MAEAQLETPRLLLRREVAGDRAAWLAHVNTPEVMEHLGGPRTSAQVHADFDRMADPDDLGWWLVARKGDGVLLGKAGLGRIEGDPVPAGLAGEVQVGWTLRADCWRQGYGRECGTALLDLAFGSVGAERVFAQTSHSNAASWHLMERLGMTRQPELAYVDPAYPAKDNPTIVYRLTASEWSGRA